MVTIKYFVHGTTTDNLSKRSTGWLPGELSDLGIAQGTELAQTIKDDHFDAVYSSDLKRAVDTAKLNHKDRDIELRQDPRLRECNYGDLNGQPESMVDYAAHINKQFPSGESMHDVETRVRDFCDYLKQNYAGRVVCIVAHRAPQLALEVICNGKIWDRAIAEDWRHTKSWQPGWTYIVT